MGRPTLTLICQHCGESFVRERKRAIGRGQSKFCTVQCAAKHRMRPPTQRFWDKVVRGPGCWEWTGLRMQGYGVLRGHDSRRGEGGQVKIVFVHRLSWEMHFGPIPDGGVVCHRCDNRACVRPDHLFLGTPLDNTADMVAKGRQARGERSPKSPLTTEQVLDIRRRVAAGESIARMGREHGVSHQSISAIVHRRTWKHVP